MTRLAAGDGAPPETSLSIELGGRVRARSWWRTPTAFGYSLLARAVL